MLHKASARLAFVLNRNPFSFSLIVLALLFAFVPVVSAQQNSGSRPGRLARIEFRGLQRLKEEQAAAASGLKIGQAIDVPTLEAASQTLIDSGLFKKLAYRYHVDNGQVTVTFTVEEGNVGVPVVFDNFVWFSDEELVAAIRRDVPTFDGTAPETGTFADQIARALERLLKEKNIQGQVEYKPSADLSGRNAKQIYSVTGVALPLCSLTFPGASGIKESELVKNSGPLMQSDYSQEFVTEFAKSNLIPLYQQKGHLRAKFLNPAAKYEGGTDCKNGVAVTIPVEEGLVYSLSKVEWAGNSALDTAELEQALGMRAGEVANGVKFGEGLKAVREAYGKRGYLTSRLMPAPDFDDASRSVSYRIDVAEGPQFRMGEFVINGLSESDAGRLKAKWKLQPGEVYDASYLKEFLGMVRLELGPMMSSAGRKGIDTQEKPNRQKLIVDVILTFK